MENKQQQALEKIEDTPPGRNDLVPAGFTSKAGFDLMLRQAKWLSTSSLVPEQFRNNIPNTVIALEIAGRMGASPLAVMQNLYIVHGKPGWSATFIIAAINATGKFSPLRFECSGAGDGRSVKAWATEKATGERLEGPAVTIEMAKKEGWSARNGSKWQTMSELMLRYRAATFFGRLYAPEILMGMNTTDEIVEIHEADFREVKEATANQGVVVDFEAPSAEPAPPPAEPEPPKETRRGRPQVYKSEQPPEFSAPVSTVTPQKEFKLQSDNRTDPNRAPGF